MLPASPQELLNAASQPTGAQRRLFAVTALSISVAELPKNNTLWTVGAGRVTGSVGGGGAVNPAFAVVKGRKGSVNDSFLHL